MNALTTRLMVLGTVFIAAILIYLFALKIAVWLIPAAMVVAVAVSRKRRDGIRYRRFGAVIVPDLLWCGGALLLALLPPALAAARLPSGWQAWFTFGWGWGIAVLWLALGTPLAALAVTAARCAAFRLVIDDRGMTVTGLSGERRLDYADMVRADYELSRAGDPRFGLLKAMCDWRRLGPELLFSLPGRKKIVIEAKDGTTLELWPDGLDNVNRLVSGLEGAGLLCRKKSNHKRGQSK